MSTKIKSGDPLPQITLERVGGGSVTTGQPQNGHAWQMVVVYRGRHCPLCTRQLRGLNEIKQSYYDIGVDIIAISGDSKEQAESHLEYMEIDLPLGYGLSIEQMQQLGLYISHPRSPEETDHPFAEPGLFLVNAEGNVQVVDISNNPFARPDLARLPGGIKWMQENDYPIRGTYE